MYLVCIPCSFICLVQQFIVMTILNHAFDLHEHDHCTLLIKSPYLQEKDAIAREGTTIIITTYLVSLSSPEEGHHIACAWSQHENSQNMFAGQSFAVFYFSFANFVCFSSVDTWFSYGCLLFPIMTTQKYGFFRILLFFLHFQSLLSSSSSRGSANAPNKK